MRAGFALLLLAGCVSSISPVSDAGSDGSPASACLVPDGGVLAVHLATPVAGCALGARDGGLMELGSLGLALQGGLLFIPDAPEGVALPVVFVFHGAGSTGAAARNYGLEAATDGGAIFVYPDAVQGTWDVGGRSADARRVELALRRLSETRCIDPDRVFITGFSAGAVFTLFLGCNVPEAFRAMGVIAGSERRFDTSCCHGQISALFIHGTADETIPLIDGQLARNHTLSRDGCSIPPEPGGSTCETHDCPAPWAVELCTWPGGHAIPDWAGAEIWRFFGSLPALE